LGELGIAGFALHLHACRPHLLPHWLRREEHSLAQKNNKTQGQFRQNCLNRPLFPFFDEEFNLRLKCLDFIAANPSDNLEPESRSPAFPKSFNHRRDSPLNSLAERNSDLAV
jgi:hypothetical protein